ncbi:hypothetical protein KUTeg_018004 [Tegillarca granosa]|uniref:Ig-like domain-containing protein n=1 Tax=Tegillarca granosa TaxID=220873 RepID=A0ABQ9EKL5_TEGGR|nr:hypothetical protein KUTeg_018004 [Tegillarca granosa]
MNILWMNPKKILVSQRDVRYIDDPRMSIENPFPGDWNLHIRYVRYQDRGEYKCTINSDPIEIRRIHLTVQVPSHIDDKLSTKEIEAVEGDNICEIVFELAENYKENGNKVASLANGVHT